MQISGGLFTKDPVCVLHWHKARKGRAGGCQSASQPSVEGPQFQAGAKALLSRKPGILSEGEIKNREAHQIFSQDVLPMQEQSAFM